METRTGLNQRLKKYNPLSWVVFLLQSIGRATYKSIFWIAKLSYLAIYKLIHFFKTFSLGKKPSITTKISISNNVVKDNLKAVFWTYASINQSLYQWNRALLLRLKSCIPHIHLIRFDHDLLKIWLKKIYLSSQFFRVPYLNLSFLNRDVRIPKLLPTIKPSVVFSYTNMVILVLLILTGASSFYYFILKDLPNPDELLTRKKVLTTKIYARDGSLLYKIYRSQNRSLIKMDELPNYLINATIAAEDKEFWQHPGFSVTGIARALQQNLTNDQYTQGGSTITQQLVKNALLSSEQTYTRKVKELVLAIEVELMFDKKQILQMYFNEIPYGGVTYGVEEAAQTYFGKSARNLNLAEAAMLAGLPTAPTRYSPFGANPEYAIYRQRQVLNQMVEQNYISQAQADQAKQTPITLKPLTEKIIAPHFVMYVKDLLVQQYGTRMVEEGGLEVITSLDPKIQKSAEEAVAQEVNELIPMRVSNGAALVTNPKTGEVLAMVGSKDYFDTVNDGNVNVTTRLRQPGSSIKPLTYALALQNGFTPVSLIEDTPVSFPDGDHAYTPVNYDGQFHGNVTLRTALGSSFNVPAVKVLNKLGVQNLISFGEKMGITTWTDRNRFGLSLTLGGGEVRMTDLAVMYGVFANGGYKVPLNPILEVKNIEGKTLLDSEESIEGLPFLPSVSAAEPLSNQAEPVLSPMIAYQISDILSDNNARIPAFGPNSLLNIPDQQVAVKTGTTNDKRDNWAIGYTPDHVVAVWVGNNDNSPMSAVASGVTGATPIWNHIMINILKDYNYQVAFKKPSEMVAVQVCKDYGVTTCLQGCQNIKTEYFLPGNIPQIPCPPPPSEEEKQKQTIQLTVLPN
ncbi:PBP1A family penicillin-binding protein [Candidatus Beckwithbacteria bacterium]|nr:PBP1A family penicillin-binding protein [Candidatus Beckwithbacteria bacterium]